MKITKVIQGIITGLLVTVIVVLLIVFFIPQCMGYQPYNVQTNGMEPDYPSGSMVYVKAEAFENYKANDVITYRTSTENGWIITHRITEIDKEAQTFYTKADHGSDEIGSIGYGLVIGKTTKFAIPMLGKLVTQYQNGNGKTITIVMIVGLMGFSFLLDFYQKKEEEA